MAGYVSSSFVTANGANVSTLDVSFVLSGGTNRIAEVGPHFEDGGPGGGVISGVVLDPGGGDEQAYARAAPTSADNDVDTSRCRQSVWSILDTNLPGAGTYTVRATYSIATINMVSVNVWELDGMEQTLAPDTQAESTALDSLTWTPSNNNSIISHLAGTITDGATGDPSEDVGVTMTEIADIKPGNASRFYLSIGSLAVAAEITTSAAFTSGTVQGCW